MKIILFLILSFPLWAVGQELPLRFDEDVSLKTRMQLSFVFQDVARILPLSFIKALPAIKIKIERLSDTDSIPADICDGGSFIYGSYGPVLKTLTLHSALVNELAKGKENMLSIKCQHKNLYDQSISTIIHELAHAYDLENGKPSEEPDYFLKAGFKRGLVFIKNKNVSASRTPDPYEKKNVFESFAVNFEYFMMDDEFACRRPSLFNYFKQKMGLDPFPQRSCVKGQKVLVTSETGNNSYEIDFSRVYRVDYLLAGAGSALESGFGHSMFRIVMCAPEHKDILSNKTIPATPYGPECLKDRSFHLVVSYRANINEATLNYIKGIFGGYPSILYLLPLADVLDQYNHKELRDIEAYPLRFTEAEKKIFIEKVIEEHWNYRGSYKFITNNCATESLDLIKNILKRPGVAELGAFTPKGIVKDLNRLDLIERESKEVEVYVAKTENLIEAYLYAYGKKINKNDIINFINKSSSIDRFKKYETFKSLKAHSLKDLRIKVSAAASFAVLEQQIFEAKQHEMMKKISEKVSETDELKKISKDLINEMDIDEGLSNTTSYGIPLEAEMIRSDEEAVQELMSHSLLEIRHILTSYFPQETEVMEAISKRIDDMRSYTLSIRKEFKEALLDFTRLEMQKLKTTEAGRSLLLRVQEKDKKALAELRHLLGEELMNTQGISDNKMIQLYQSL